ncbi:phosphate/phosphite/phosphonate ABC transporter substrate-binding protein [uncultured Desulfuromusa sp.]|uniref:phosphate/phosphite/phosphonate ABC transporter substrate-binding protein n=1 Tax=uncultured Desulfuromusa sp. TaxID=219183 RepID=UPI002AA75DF1|nr:phosphate/phosphite/phosphonate ABC transporter substrate-binding protein [uncultured Desulfuromusa sp.]
MINKQTKLFLSLWVFIAFFVSPACGQEPLTLGVHPFQSISILKQQFTPLTNYLTKKLGHKVELRVGTNYQEHIDTVGQNQIDIAYIGPVGYVQLTAQYGQKKLIAVQEVEGKATFAGIIFARSDSSLESLLDLTTGEIAFVEPHSTMGFILPSYVILHENPAIITQHRYQFLKTHENVALAVLSGDFVAGAVKENIFYEYQEKGLKKLAVTPEVAEHLFIARADLPEKILKKTRQAFLDLNNSSLGLSIMHAIKPTITQFNHIEDSDYNSLRAILAELKQKGLTE